MPRNNKDSLPKRFSALLPYLWPALAVAAGLHLLLAPSQPTTVADSSIQAASDRSEIEQVSLSREATPHATRNIEDIRVGDRVLAANPEITEEERATWGEPDWTDWQHVELEMTQTDGGVLQIAMIRPREWFDLNRVEPGTELFLDLSEMGAQGPAQVVSISACPHIRSGSGQVVTATFAHPPSTTVLDVRFEGDSQPIGVTDNHLFWSTDREDFIAIGEMSIGERVLTYSGETKRLAQKLPRPGPQLVYNLEVYGEHVYFVSDQGLLVHNQYNDDVAAKGVAGTWTRAETPWGRSVLQRNDIDWNYRRADGMTNLEAARRGNAPRRVGQKGREEVLVLHHFNNDPGSQTLAEVWSSLHSKRHAADRLNGKRIKTESPDAVPDQLLGWRDDHPEWATEFTREQSVYWRWYKGGYTPPADAIAVPPSLLPNP